MNTFDKLRQHLPIVERDEWLRPVEGELNNRHGMYLDRMNDICSSSGSIVDYANGYRYFGWQYDDTLSGWWFREWLPEAQDVYLFGDFNNWQRTELRLQKDSATGVWSIFLPDAMYSCRLTHGSLYKIHVHGANGWHDRIPAYATRVVQDDETKNFSAQFWIPQPFDWSGDGFDIASAGSLLIYEAHVGMAQEREGVGTYAEFTKKILPTIKKDGYNAVQLGFQDVPERKLTKPEVGHLKKDGEGVLKKFIKDFKLKDTESLNVGDVIDCSAFAEG
ncbi:MAG: hypothetical protein K2J51_07495, partial [Alistipes sp.]|nr:hypothetical protein [Alistipes sp.]